MAIKVITPGLKKFQATCPICGCVFEYEREDLQEGEGIYSGKFYIKCPDCGKAINHKEHIKPISYNPSLDNVILTTREEDGRVTLTQPKQEDPCENCPNRESPKDAWGRPVPGDSMCQWCPHYKWKVTWNELRMNKGY